MRATLVLTITSVYLFFHPFKSSFHFLISQQVTAVAAGIDMIRKHLFSRLLTSQDGHL